MMKPVKAFMYQDHQSHIMVHMSAMQDPKIMSLLQNNPMAQQLQAAMMAHINEHLGFEYRKQIEQQLGMSLPPQKDEAGDDINMDPEVEARLAPLLAQAAQRLLAGNQQQAAQQQAQQQAQDPLVQLQQQELQIKQGDLQRKVSKDATDAQLKQAQLALEAQRQKVDTLKSIAEMKNNKQEHMMDIGVDVLKHLSDKHHAKAGQERDHLHTGLQTVLNKNREMPTMKEE
jgi:multidrug efflux pump subunit AcrA (membrane-fusion protein)